MDRFTSICQRLCNLPCCKRSDKDEPKHRRDEAAWQQARARQTVLEKAYPVSDDRAARRRRYELDMLLLFRLYHHKRFHRQIPPDMDDKTRQSLTRLIVFTCAVPPPRGEELGASRDGRVRGGGGEEGYLTELAR
ncbi:MAG: hypothetical protein Q9196_006069, partial [Gyalolechia fulgens]